MKKLGIDDYLAAGGDLDDLILKALPANDATTLGDATKERIRQLAGLSSFEYEQSRQSAAADLGVRVSALDREIANFRSEDPAPEGPPQWARPGKICNQPVDEKQLLDDLINAIKRFVALDHSAALVVALWVLFTWLFECIAETNPFLRIISATSECGKSTLLKVIMRLARSGWIVSRLSASSFIRTMRDERRTLMLDEGDAFLKHNELMRNVLDGASDPDTANVSISVKASNDDWTPAEFNTFIPICIASIGVLWSMQTVESRSIAINLKRATKKELLQLSKGRRRELKEALGPLAERCARWAADNGPNLTGKRPELPEALGGREMDNWEPLVIIADAISCDAGKAARLAAVKMSGAKEGDGWGTALLADIHKIFSETSENKLTSRALCDELAKLEGHPWAEYGSSGRPISQNQLARLLRPFAIVPHTVWLRDNSTAKGYERKDFVDAWERYPPPSKPGSDDMDKSTSEDPDRQDGRPRRAVRESGGFESVRQDSPDGSENGTLPHGEKDLTV
jgi:putative DNA primase/helicase